MAFLEVKGLRAYYRQTQALYGLNFELEEGSITTILGANGAGKTTTLRSICRMIRTEGEIQFDGDDLTSLSTENVVRRGIAHVPEGRGTFVRQSVEDNLQLGAYTRKNKTAITDDIERVYTYFPRLRERFKQQAGTLSGGEQQMVAIGRALMSRPRVLLMDEPSMGLAPALVQQNFELIQQIHEEGMAIFMVEQNANMALSIADRGWVLQTGRVVLDDTAEALLANPELRSSYLGES